jgi:hypothetical protein
MTVTSVRLLLEVRAKSIRVTRLAAMMSQALRAISEQSRGQFAKGVFRLIVGAVSLTLLMSGMISTWVEALFVFVFITFLLWTRAQLQTTSHPLFQVIAHVPWLIRFAIGLVVSYLMNRAIVSALWNQTQSFRPVLLATCLSVAILTVLTAVSQPGLRNAKTQRRPQPRG